MKTCKKFYQNDINLRTNISGILLQSRVILQNLDILKSHLITQNQYSENEYTINRVLTKYKAQLLFTRCLLRTSG